MTDSAQDIRDRTFVFACAVAKLALQIEPRPGLRCEAGSSRREFVRYLEIALREAREAAYWLRICLVLQVGPAEELKQLTGEASQICRILGAIVVKTKFADRAGLAVFVFCILNFALLFS